MSDQGRYSPRFEAEVMARFDALDSRVARVEVLLDKSVVILDGAGRIVVKLDAGLAGAECEAESLAYFCAAAHEIRESLRYVNERLHVLAELRIR